MITEKLAGGLATALLLTAPVAAAAAELAATLDDGTVLASAEIADGQEWCVLWNHSVQGFGVTDCYENRSGTMTLVRSHWPDAAAGLDHIPGRGRQISDGKGGYWIVDLDEPVTDNAYVLRTGSRDVDHRIELAGAILPLSAKAPHERLTISLRTTE